MEANKLRWRCRRGTLELDLMLLRYLDSSYSKANFTEQQAFLELLDFEDMDLLRFLMGEQCPDNPILVGLVELIRNLPVSDDRDSWPHVAL